MDDVSRRRLGELANRLDDLIAGRSESAELADLVLLADGLTEVLLHEVARARDLETSEKPDGAVPRSRDVQE